MASVFLAALQGPAGFQKLVVLKEMRGDLAEDPEFRRMFVEEARVAARLNHPNVVQTFEAFEAEGVFTIVMEFLDGQPLNKMRTAARREVLLPLQLLVVSQALAGLEHVHQAGLVHRDISPQNIFVTYDGGVKVLDFGIVKQTDSSVHTAVGTLKGKLGYMAPEQVLGKRIDPRTDVFAMGVVLWEALTGTRLWAGIPEPAIIGRLASGMIPTVRSVKPDVPEELDAICACAMSVDPDHRFATALDFQSAVDAFIAKMTVTPKRRDLAQLMNSMFAEQRKRLRDVLEDALSGRTRNDTERPPPLATLPSAPGPSGASLPPTAVTATGGRIVTGATSSSLVGTKSSGRTAVVFVVGLVLATVLGVAVGAATRRTPSVGAASSTHVSSAPPGAATAAATASAASESASEEASPSTAPLSAETTPTATATASKASGSTNSSAVRGSKPISPTVPGVTSSSPNHRAPDTHKRPGEVDLGY